MNKVIDGKYYDSDKAKEIVTIDNGYFRNDFHYFEETLYQKENGDYFLHSIGGALTELRTRCGSNTYEGGEAIRPICLDEAKDWVAKKCDGETYISLFGEVE